MISTQTSCRNGQGQLLSFPRREAQQDFAVDLLVGSHPLAGIGVGLGRRAALCALQQREYEHATKCLASKTSSRVRALLHELATG